LPEAGVLSCSRSSVEADNLPAVVKVACYALSEIDHCAILPQERVLFVCCSVTRPNYLPPFVDSIGNAGFSSQRSEIGDLLPFPKASVLFARSRHAVTNNLTTVINVPCHARVAA